jgi:hypothetical protein
VTGDPARSPLAEQLLGLAERRHDGVLAAPGRQHEIHLRAGRITHVRAGGTAGDPGAPGDPGSPGGPAGPDAAAGVSAVAALAAREAFLDGVREFLSADPGAATRWKAPKTRSPLDSAGVHLSVPAVLAEVARRCAVLERLDDVVTPDTPLTRRPELPDAVRITPAQWALLARVEETATPRELAAALGDSVFRSVCRAYELLRLGLLEGPPATVPVRYGARSLFLGGYAQGLS